VPAIVAAQAVTVIASPLVAGALWWLTSRADIMGSMQNSRFTNVMAGVGFLLLLAIAAYTAAVKIPQKVDSLRESTARVQSHHVGRDDSLSMPTQNDNSNCQM
jgi:hypothetical protein